MEAFDAHDAQATNGAHDFASILIERFKAAFTVPNKCKLRAFLRDRINCVEIVAP
jgi:hypothetical protein